MRLTAEAKHDGEAMAEASRSRQPAVGRMRASWSKPCPGWWLWSSRGCWLRESVFGSMSFLCASKKVVNGN